MAACEFKSYQPTPGEKYLGIVTVKRHNDIIRFKWVAKKDGKGCFASSCSIKIVEDGQDVYLPAFLLDSLTEREEMDTIIRRGVNAAIAEQTGRPQIQMSASALQPEPSNLDDCPF